MGIFDGKKKEDRIYVDGKMASTNPRNEDIVPDGDLPVYVGAVAPGQYFFKGALDDLVIYSRVLTDAEIQQDMNSVILSVESKGKLTATWAEIKLQCRSRGKGICS